MGKVLGLLVGALSGYFIGGVGLLLVPVLGVALGHIYDSQTGFTDPDDPALHERGASREELDREARATFARFLAALFVQLAEVDGPMTRDEAAAIRAFFEGNLGFDAKELEGVRQALQAARAQPQSLELAAAAAREALNPAERTLLLYALGQVAVADHPLGEEESALLAQIAEALQIPPEIARAMAPGSEQTEADAPAPTLSAEDAYARLGVRAEAGDDEIKRAYRALAQKLHPDKVAHLGEEAVALAQRAFAEVNVAYEEIRRERGL